MLLKDKIYADLVAAMKPKEALKLETLRGLKAEIMKYEVSGADKVADDSQVLKILKKQVKQRQDSASQFANAGRLEDAEKENTEKEILEAYLPKQMSEAEIEKIVDALIAETGFTGKGDFGKLMGPIMQKVGNSADGNIVKEILQSKLN